MNVTPSSSSEDAGLGTPRFRVPLWPTPMPSTARPGASRSSDAIEAADTAGCRVARFVTQSATRARRVSAATSVAATHGSIALPGVSAIPTIP